MMHELKDPAVRASLIQPPAKTPGIDPLTIVDCNKTVTFDELAKRIERTRQEHGAVLQQYHEVWYNAPHTWHYTHFLGVGLMKCPNDLWIYQALMHDYRPKTVIETGTYSGASALWFAFLMEMLQIDGGHVYTVDYADQRQCQHSRITFLGGNSVDPELVAGIEEQLPEEGVRLISLDSDHSARHVYDELCLYAPLCRVGDWLVVEDTNIAWSNNAEGIGGDRGAQGGLVDYLNEHPGEFRQDVLCERYLLTMNPGGWLQRIAPHRPLPLLECSMAAFGTCDCERCRK